MTEEAHAEQAPQTIPEEAAALLDTIGEPAHVPEAQAPAPAIPTQELIAPIVAMVCAVVVPAWEITQAEQEQLSGAYAAVVDKYFPEGLPMGPELGALLVTAAVVMPRLGKPTKHAQEDEEGAPDA